MFAASKIKNPDLLNVFIKIYLSDFISFFAKMSQVFLKPCFQKEFLFQKNTRMH